MWRKGIEHDDLLEILYGLGRMLQEIDAKLEEIVELLEHEFGDE